MPKEGAQLMFNLPTSTKNLKEYLHRQPLEKLELIFEQTDSDDLMFNYIADEYERKLLYKQMSKDTYINRLLNNQVKPYQIEESKWDVVLDRNYITIEDYGTAKRVLMCADMGTGKNYCWDSALVKHRILAPLRSIVGQYGSTNDVKSSSLTTYDQAVRLIELVEAGKINPRDEILVVDEAHNFMLTSYRLRALNSVEKLLRFDWKQIIFQSATIESNDLDVFFTFDEKIRVHKTGKASMNYTRAQMPRFDDCIQEVVKHYALNSHKTIILLNDKNKISQLAAVLIDMGLSVEVVDADRTRELGTVAYDMCLDANFCMGTIDILIGTTSLVEGISIKDNLDIANAFVIGDEHPAYIKQLCGRFRNAGFINCLHLAANSYKNTIPDMDKWIEDKKMANKIMIEDCLYYAKSYQTFGSYDNAALLNVSGFNLERNGIYFNDATNRYLISSLYLLFQSAEAKKLQFYSDFAFGTQVMQSFGFNIQRHVRTESFDDLEDGIAATKKRVRIGEKQKRADSAEAILGIVEKATWHGSKNLDQEFYRELRNKKFEVIDMNPFQSRIENVIYAFPNKSLTLLQFKKMVQAMIKGQLNDETIIRYNLASLSDNGIISELYKSYLPGDVLTKDKQLLTLQYIIKSLIELTVNANNLTEQEAFTFVMKQDNWKASKDKIYYSGGNIIIKTQRPSLILKHYIPPFKSIRRRVNGILCRMIEIL
jgi:hypothetical protein